MIRQHIRKGHPRRELLLRQWCVRKAIFDLYVTVAQKACEIIIAKVTIGH